MRALGGRRWPSVVALTVVIALLAAGLVLLLTGRGGRPPAPRTALPSPGPTRTPLLAAVGTAAPAPTSAGLQQALAGVLTDPALGRRVVLSVLDAATGQPLLERSADQGVVPASTAKIATAVAALAVLPPDRRFRTRVVAGAGPGDVVLVGGGDPTLSGANPLPGFARTARLRDLAARLRGTGVRRVLVDDGLFAGPRSGPGWKPGYVTGGDVTPVSALEVDGGRLAAGLHAGRTPDPALQAGRQLAGLLGVRTAVTRTTAVAGARELAAVQSPPLSELVETMLGRSDNDVAEALGRQVALERHLPATFAGEAEAVAAAVGELVPAAGFALRDASGLSPLDRVAPGSLTRLLAAVAPMPRYAALVAGLPVAGFDGTLQGRYRRGPAVAAAGSVRAKTGTLSGVSALAGLVRTRDGRLLAFDLTADGVPASGTRASQAALDRVAAVLAGCGCGPTAPAPTQGTLPVSPPGGTPAT